MGSKKILIMAIVLLAFAINIVFSRVSSTFAVKDQKGMEKVENLLKEHLPHLE